ncbi:MAG TPA: integrase [Gammaproteobacteria bacterium]|nr:integrase [Gammaproteobacteria bacterium]
MKNKEKHFVFTGPFKDYCFNYVNYKKELGFSFGEGSLYLLRYMDDYFKHYNLSSPVLTKKMVEDFVSHRSGESEKTQRMRMSIVRQFALFMNRIGFDFYVYPYKLKPIAKTFTPYIFTHDEIERIITVVDHLTYIPQSKHYHLIYPMLFRMLYGCGLRINEALSLKKSEVDLSNGILTITKAKNSTSRLVPMSRSLTDYCKRFAENMSFDMSGEGYFYPSRDAGKYHRTPVYVKFKQLMRIAGIFPEGAVGPRVHDIRHTYAVHALEKMINDGQDVYCTLPILSTYLGHRGIESTEKYLRLTEEAYGAVTNTMASFYTGVFPEVVHHE